ncbi:MULTISPECIES: hypothetical protein [unclassified Lacticaseibacillus]|uniref:hypothetical protein n=1 Tax=unclassified Lacticaseibacillus TaxID=2759744 RepID=UPI0019454814|nr:MULTISPECIES: hypothetical protein [unclassified Lacticaseibacillus]
MDDQTLLELAAMMLQPRRDKGNAVLAAKLHIPVAAVASGDAALTAKQRDGLRYLFTDYEWMLAQKIVVLNATAPSEEGVAWRFQEAKATIAQAWLRQSGVQTAVKETKDEAGSTAHLQIRMDYGAHGLVDLLDFIVPAKDLQKLETKQLTLLEWTKKQLPAPRESD